MLLAGDFREKGRKESFMGLKVFRLASWQGLVRLFEEVLRAF
jgi:hypothetical protein